VAVAVAVGGRGRQSLSYRDRNQIPVILPHTTFKLTDAISHTVSACKMSLQFGRPRASSGVLRSCSEQPWRSSLRAICTFGGDKSLHFGLRLSESYPSTRHIQSALLKLLNLHLRVFILLNLHLRVSFCLLSVIYLLRTGC
jgi:hypothetical protein